jgi:hypothetical protein
MRAQKGKCIIRASVITLKRAHLHFTSSSEQARAKICIAVKEKKKLILFPL